MAQAFGKLQQCQQRRTGARDTVRQQPTRWLIMLVGSIKKRSLWQIMCAITTAMTAKATFFAGRDRTAALPSKRITGVDDRLLPKPSLV